ncbi:hypothetical protein [Microbacterium sp. NPDC055683]
MTGVHGTGRSAAELEKRFRANVLAIAAFEDENGRWPTKASSDKLERSLGHTLHELRQAARGNGTMRWTREREQFLDEHAPGWRGARESPNARFARRVDDVAHFHSRRGRFPSTSASDSWETMLGRWLTSVRNAQKGRGSFEWTPERASMAAKLPDGWEGVDHDARFEERAIALRDFLRSEGRTPRSTAEEAGERRLAVWLAKVRFAARGGETSLVMNDRRRAALDEHVPGWNAPDGPQST